MTPIAGESVIVPRMMPMFQSLRERACDWSARRECWFAAARAPRSSFPRRPWVELLLNLFRIEQVPLDAEFGGLVGADFDDQRLDIDLRAADVELLDDPRGCCCRTGSGAITMSALFAGSAWMVAPPAANATPLDPTEAVNLRRRRSARRRGSPGR